MSRLSRLSARGYGRLTPDQRQAVDLLEWGEPDAAARGEAKTMLGWRRTRDETIAYARALLARGLMPAAVADRLGVGDRYLRKLLDEVEDSENRARKRSAHAARSGTNRQRQGERSYTGLALTESARTGPRKRPTPGLDRTCLEVRSCTEP